MTVGKRITFGFSLILLIAVMLGATAIYIMSGIEKEAAILAGDYAPEVKIISSLERNARRVMYDARGYGFTEDESFLKGLEPWQKRLHDRIEKAHVLAKKSKVLVKLGPAMKIFDEQVTKYEGLLLKTEEHIGALKGLRSKMDDFAGAYLKATNAYLANQNKQMRKEFENANLTLKQRQERLEKITLINDAIDLANNIRVMNFKSQTLRDPVLYQTAIDTFAKITPIGKRLARITYKASDKVELVAIKNARNEYRQAMIVFLEKWNELQKLGTERNKVGGEVVKIAEEVSNAGIAGSIRISKSAMVSATTGNLTLIIGLIVAVLIGMILSFFLVRAITGPISNIASDLKDSSNQVASASGELSSASQQLAEASNEQASSIEETSASLEELTGMVKNNVDNAKRSNELSDEVKGISEQGNESMQQLIKSMNDILESNDQIQNLVKVIGEIGEKTAIIDEIVFQTKLLSFNASVEAERAGEHGRGFAVVAQEVGNLAQMSGNAALEISNIVKDSVRNAEDITRDNKGKVESGNSLVKEVAELLQSISDKSQMVTDNAKQVLGASEDQAKGIEQINTAMGQLDKATQENSATSEEAASSSEELAAQAEALNGFVGDLTKLVTGTAETASISRSQTKTKSVKTVQNATTERTLGKASNSKESDAWEQL